MGWWHPYFFSDITGVQLLISPLVIGDGGVPLPVACALIWLLCFVERWTSRKLKQISSSTPWVNTTNQNHHNPQQHQQRTPMQEVTFRTWIYALHTTLHFLVMLIVMSFNLWLVVMVVFGLAGAEFFFLWRQIRIKPNIRVTDVDTRQQLLQLHTDSG